MLEPQYIVARDLPDAWFQALYKILEDGHIYTIDRGSYMGQQRLEFDFVTFNIKYPEVRPLIPKLSPALGIPDPVADGYIEEYLPYLMTDKKQPTEDYSYGTRLCHQVDEVIKMFRDQGPGTNQACMEVGQPSDIYLSDPPCLRLVDCRLRDGKLHFVVYFRSWDMFNGMPANLAALQLMKEYMADEIGVEPGQTIASSKGLHLYDYVWDIAKQIRGNS